MKIIYKHNILMNIKYLKIIEKKISKAIKKSISIEKKTMKKYSKIRKKARKELSLIRKTIRKTTM